MQVVSLGNRDGNLKSSNVVECSVLEARTLTQGIHRRAKEARFLSYTFCLQSQSFSKHEFAAGHAYSCMYVVPNAIFALVKPVSKDLQILLNHLPTAPANYRTSK